jgi:hypothetical protein
MICINTSSPEYKRLLQQSGLPESILKAKIAMWQSQTKNFEDFPKFEDIDTSANSVVAVMKSINILSSSKATIEFAKGEKNNWSLDKILKELQLPKEQRELILTLDKTNQADIVVELLSNYTFPIEINLSTTGTNKVSNDVDDFTLGDYYYSSYQGNYMKRPINENGDINWDEDALIRISKKEYDVLEKTLDKRVPTSYYSNLTVPGGTNYTENEIAVPNMVPNIKGHAQFATDNGIGWFRSDDKFSSTLKSDEDIQEYLKKGVEDFKAGRITQQEFFDIRDLKNIGFKTRRILEVQSDLFQKGRDKKDLVGYTAETLSRYVEYWEGDDMQYVKEYYDIPATKRKENAFLQLLNKNNNWATFFVKAIIQDSAKKGYEKVLFPKGDTAAKVEGHGTLEEFKREKQLRLDSLQTQVEGDKEVYEKTKSVNAKERINKHEIEIAQLKQELERIEGPEGFSALKPIYNFYENIVTNILLKQFGKDNIRQITDEYGNAWNEIVINPERDSQPVFYQEGKRANEIEKSITELTPTVHYELLDSERTERLKWKVDKSFAILSGKASEKWENYLKKSRGSLPKEFHDEVSDLLYVKANKNNRSNLYHAIDYRTGETIKEKIRLFSKEGYAEKMAIQTQDSLYSASMFSPKRSFAFALYLNKPSKSTFVAKAKQYLHGAIKMENEQFNETGNRVRINLDEIDNFLSMFPESMWDYVKTTLLNDIEYGTKVNAEINLGKLDIEVNLPKLGLIQELEKKLGIPLLGETFKNYDRSGKLSKLFAFYGIQWGDLITIDASLTTKQLRAAISYYLKTKNIIQPSDELTNIKKYAEHTNTNLDWLMKVMTDSEFAHSQISYNNSGESDDMQLARFKEDVRTYDWQAVELFREPVRAFKKQANEYFSEKFKDQTLKSGIPYFNYYFSGQFPVLNIGFNTLSGKNPVNDNLKITENESYQRLAAVLHEPFHALHALTYGTREEREMKNAFDNLIATDFGKSLIEASFGDSVYGGKQINNDLLYKEFTAFLFQAMNFPQDWIKKTNLRSNDIYEFIQKVQSLQDKTYKEIVTRREYLGKQKVKRTETFTEREKVGEREYEIQELEEIKLNFLEKLYNLFVSGLHKILPILKGFINLLETNNIVTKKMREDIFEDVTKQRDIIEDIDMYGTIEEEVERVMKLPKDVLDKKNEFLGALDGLKSAMDTLLAIDEKFISPTNTPAFFKEGSRSYSQESKEPIKKGINEVFQKNPRLSTIGTQEQYNRYLNTVFPDSVVKDILYHGTYADFTSFDKEKKGSTTGLGYYTDRKTGEKIDFDSQNAIFFSDNYRNALSYSFMGRENFIDTVSRNLSNVLRGIGSDGKTRGDKEIIQKSLDFIKTIPYFNNLIEKAKSEGKSTLEIKDLLLKESRNLFEKTRSVSTRTLTNSINNLEREQEKLLDYLNQISRFKKNDLTIPNEFGDFTSHFDMGNNWNIFVDKNNRYEFIYNNKKVSERFHPDSVSDEKIENFLKTILKDGKDYLKETRKDMKRAGYKENVIAAVVNLKNPLTHDYEKSSFPDTYKNTDKPTAYIGARQVRKALADSNDGVVYNNVVDPLLSNNYGIFETDQIHILGGDNDIQMFENFVANEVAKTEPVKENPIKEGVAHIFEQNPELVLIGTAQDYSDYLDTIFPNSPVKDIVYHGTDQRFDEFDKSAVNKIRGKSRTEFIHFSTSLYLAMDYSAQALGYADAAYMYKKAPEKMDELMQVISALINGDRIINKNVEYGDKFELEQKGIPVENTIFKFFGSELAVFSPKQIHILGGEEDMRKFQEYMNFKNNVKDYFNLNEEDTKFVKDISNLNLNC